jgi:branched-chain amino acid transport system substrate-binding protein
MFIVTAAVIFAVINRLGVEAMRSQNTQTLGVFNQASFFDNVFVIGAPISMDAGDIYSTIGLQLLGGWQLWANQVNNGGGITYNGQQWGVQLVEVEDYSDSTVVTYIANQMAGAAAGTTNYVDFMFAPYSTGLTKYLRPVTDANNKVMMSSSSNSNTFWNTDNTNGFGTLYPSGGWWANILPMYRSKGASTAGFICGSDPSQNSCSGFFTQASIEATFTSYGFTEVLYYELDPTSATYDYDLNEAISTMMAANIDLLLLNDYVSICIDAPAVAVELGWTPPGMYLMVCNNNADVREALGSSLWYAATYTMWSSSAIYSSATTTNQQFVTDFKDEFNTEPAYQAAASYAAGEILQLAIEQCNCIDTATLSGTIADAKSGAGWATIMSVTSLTFPAENYHLASGSWVTLQYTDIGSTYDVTTTSELVYPMPSWSSRSATTSAPVTAPVGSSSVNDDDNYTTAQVTGLALTAIFCFLGGIVTAVLLLVCIPQHFTFGSVGKAAATETKSTIETEMVGSPVHEPV